MRSPEDPAGRRGHAQCQSLASVTSFSIKGSSATWPGSPAAEDTGETPPAQPPVGVVVSEGSCGSSPAVKPKYLPVGVVDTFSDNLADPSFRPGVYWVSEPAETNLFGGWTQEQLISAQETDPDIAPVKKWLDEGRGRPPWVDIAPYSPATKAYWSQCKRLYQKDGVLLW